MARQLPPSIIDEEPRAGILNSGCLFKVILVKFKYCFETMIWRPSGGFKITHLISLTYIGLFRWCTSYKVSLVVCVFQEICPFHLNSQNLRHTYFVIILYYTLNDCRAFSEYRVQCISFLTLVTFILFHFFFIVCYFFYHFPCSLSNNQLLFVLIFFNFPLF